MLVHVFCLINSRTMLITRPMPSLFELASFRSFSFRKGRKESKCHNYYVLISE